MERGAARRKWLGAGRGRAQSEQEKNKDQSRYQIGGRTGEAVAERVLGLGSCWRVRNAVLWPRMCFVLQFGGGDRGCMIVCTVWAGVGVSVSGSQAQCRRGEIRSRLKRQMGGIQGHGRHGNQYRTASWGPQVGAVCEGGDGVEMTHWF